MSLLPVELLIHGLVNWDLVKNWLCSHSDAIITDQFQVYHNAFKYLQGDKTNPITNYPVHSCQKK